MKRKKCHFPDGISIRPDGEHELDPCPYQTKELHTNVTVEVRQCPICGAIDISWYRQDDTEDIIYEDLEEEPDDN